MIIILRLSNIEVTIQNKRILSAIDFSWQQGETIALIGGNGAGKSTLLKILSLLVKPTGGKLLFPKDMSQQAWKQRIGAVFPDNFLYDSLTAAENLQFYQQLYGRSERHLIEFLLHRVQLESFSHDPVRSYSKGMKQRLSIARALVHRPEYLLLDEPFDGLDLKSKVIIEEILGEHKKNGNGYILVSHDVKQAFALCERVILLHRGEIAADEATSETRIEPFISMYQMLLEKN